jgi:flotillin
MPKDSAAEKVVSLTKTTGGVEPKLRYADGWRAGKPAEDPEKLKKWGLISATPSEFLIHMRRGEVRARTSGQGSRCFKFPGDSVAIIPTTVQRLHFTADQVTSEKVGVQVTGLAVYRISDPLIAFRMLNFSYPERASEKLEELLVEMFVGAARRLVANLTVEECLTHRKEELAGQLMREIAPVVSGRGKVEDHTDKGWGVVIDTIEIQDVRVLSSAVFANMQARYRKELERQARESQAEEGARAQAAEAEAARQVALAKLASESEVRERRTSEEEKAKLTELAMKTRLAEAELAQQRGAMAAKQQAELERSRLETEIRETKQAEEERLRLYELSSKARLAEADLAQRRAHALAVHASELEHARMEAELKERERAEQEAAQLAAIAQERTKAAVEHEAQLEHARQAAEALATEYDAQLRAAAHETQLEQARAQKLQAAKEAAEAELALAELNQRRAELAQRFELERLSIQREIDNRISPESIQLALAQSLPQLAAAFQQKLGTVNVTAVDGANPFGFVAAAVEGVMGLARSAGLKLPAAPAEEKA